MLMDLAYIFKVEPDNFLMHWLYGASEESGAPKTSGLRN